MLLNFFLFFYLVRWPTSYIQSQCTTLHHKLMSAILHIASLVAHTTLNTYKPVEIRIKRSPRHWFPSEGLNSELFAHENDALTARPVATRSILVSSSHNKVHYLFCHQVLRMLNSDRWIYHKNISCAMCSNSHYCSILPLVLRYLYKLKLHKVIK